MPRTVKAGASSRRRRNYYFLKGIFSMALARNAPARGRRLAQRILLGRALLIPGKYPKRGIATRRVRRPPASINVRLDPDFGTPQPTPCRRT